MTIDQRKELDSNNSQTQIYQLANGELEIVIDKDLDTIWLTQEQIALVFDVGTSAISKHIRNIYAHSELNKMSTLSILERVQIEGQRTIVRNIKTYNLDIILSVGYKVNSIKATKFRQWTSSILKSYLTEGYALNKTLLEKKQGQIAEITNTLKLLTHNIALVEGVGDINLLGILKRYSQSLITLNQYDEDNIVNISGTESINIEITELREIIKTTKTELINKGESTELFGKEYHGKFDGTISAVYQSFGGGDVYPTAEEKAANLLYLVIKNHSFVDGNKRIGSILFVYFLSKHNILYSSNGNLKITENTLVALALLVAQSNPNDKAILIKLIVKLLHD